MKYTFPIAGVFLLGIAFQFASFAQAQDAPAPAGKASVTALEQALNEAKEGASVARKRLAVRRVIRDAETMLESLKDKPERFPLLEFVFRARKQIIAIDDDPEHRKALLETCRELVKAPDEMAAIRVEADLLLSQAELAKKGGDASARANSLIPFVSRYIDTPEGARVLRMAMVMALELGDSRVVSDLQEMMEKRFAADLEMIDFQRDKLGGQVFGAPFSGAFERSDGKLVRFPMQGFGRLTLCVFWSNDEKGLRLIKGLATASLAEKDNIAGRLEIVSFNLDNLPDAGESIIRGLGADWQALRLPGGQENPIFKAYARTAPRTISVSPSGYSAMIMSGSAKQKYDPSGEIDYSYLLNSSLSRGEWSNLRYAMQLVSVSAGDFLVLDPEGSLNSALPPELKAASKAGAAMPLAAGAKAVPDETLRLIQESLVKPPQRYRQTYAEALASYSKTAELCRKAIADHPSATNLWIVRNRLIVALMGMWKTKSDLKFLEAAATEAKAALAAGYPKGCDVTARFCIARVSLSDLASDSKKVIESFLSDCGGEAAPGPAYAAASLLALDSADRVGFERYRKYIIAEFAEHPMMWTYTAFLLDRYHSYWLFQVPFSAGWSYGRRQDYFLSKGDAENAQRILRTELSQDQGKSLRIPEDLDSQWTAIVFAKGAPWSIKRDDGLPPMPKRTLKTLSDFAAKRPAGDVKVLLTMLSGDVASTLAGLADPKNPNNHVACPTFLIPGGMESPLIQRLGILSEDNQLNSVLVNKDGRIAVMLSGIDNRHRDDAILNIIMQEDEKAITTLLERGDIQAARDKIFLLAPPFDPNAVDARGHKLPKPTVSLAHLRARARVYMALKNYDEALADAEEVVQRQLGTDGGMSLRTDELDKSEALRAEVLKLRDPGKEKK
jgi:hypothetical protein